MLMFVPRGCSDKEWPLAFDHDFLCFGHTILFLLDSYRVYANFQHCLSVSDMEVIRRKEEKAYVTGYALRRDVKGKDMPQSGAAASRFGKSPDGAVRSTCGKNLHGFHKH